MAAIKFKKGPLDESAPAKRRRIARDLADLLGNNELLFEEVDALLSAKNEAQGMTPVTEQYEEYDCE